MSTKAAAGADEPEDDGSWKAKAPADMTDAELRAAKTAAVGFIQPAQDALNTWSAVVANLDYEIYNRFKIVGSTAGIGSLPAWPADAVAAS